jgi:hypothetical protein
VVTHVNLVVVVGGLEHVATTPQPGQRLENGAHHDLLEALEW